MARMKQQTLLSAVSDNCNVLDGAEKQIRILKFISSSSVPYLQGLRA